jgi:hypothetical protein
VHFLVNPFLFQSLRTVISEQPRPARTRAQCWRDQKVLMNGILRCEWRNAKPRSADPSNRIANFLSLGR